MAFRCLLYCPHASVTPRLRQGVGLGAPDCKRSSMKVLMSRKADTIRHKLPLGGENGNITCRQGEKKKRNKKPTITVPVMISNIGVGGGRVLTMISPWSEIS